MRIDYSSCPACSSKQFAETDDLRVSTCKRCGAIFGTLPLGTSYQYVLPYFEKQPAPIEQCRYFDFLCIASDGLRRRHGWYNPANKLIVQAG